MFSVYHCYLKGEQQHMPFLATFAQKPEAEWYAGMKLKRVGRPDDYMVIRERSTGLKWEIFNTKDKE